MMSVGTAFAYIMGVCFLCSILGLVLINLCAVADFIINSRRGDEPYISHVRTEIDRVHREAARDRHHAFGSVEIAKPDPWRYRTGLTI